MSDAPFDRPWRTAVPLTQMFRPAPIAEYGKAQARAMIGADALIHGLVAASPR
jgi:hypothetical protein